MMSGITVPEEYQQKSSGSYFPNDDDQSGLRDGQVTQADLNASLTANIFPYKKYIASLTQSGTGAPVATVLENSLGATITWSRNDTGDYSGVASGDVFTANKTFIVDAKQIEGGDGLSGAIFAVASVSAISALTYTGRNLKTYSAADDVLSGTLFELRVYPA